MNTVGHKRVLITLARSGTHWLKNMIAGAMGVAPYEGRLLTPELLEEALSAHAQKRLCYDHMDSQKTMATLMRHSAGMRAVLLYRHPLDAMISSFYYLAMKGWLPDADLTVKENLINFIRGDCHWPGARVAEVFREHWFYQIGFNEYFWRCAADWLQCNFILAVRYEDLLLDCEGQMLRVLNHLNIEVPINRLRQIIRDNAFDKLSGGRPPGEEDRDSHYRRGLPGEWRTFFTREEILLIEGKIGTVFEVLGYQRPIESL